MGDFGNYVKQGPAPGRTVRYEVTELLNADGSHPIVHLEHLGRTNATWMEELLAAAGKDKDTSTADVRDELTGLARSRATIIKHCAKHLENAFFSDGTLATDADLPGFIAAMPPHAFERMFVHASDQANYCEYPISTPPDQIAEK